MRSCGKCKDLRFYIKNIYTVSVIEGTAPPFVFQTFDSPNLFPLVCVLHYLHYCCPSDRAGGERLGESNVCKTIAGAVPSITDNLFFDFIPPHAAVYVRCTIVHTYCRSVGV